MRITAHNKKVQLICPIVGMLWIAVVIFPLIGCVSLVDRLTNRVRMSPPFEVSPEAQRLHRRLLVVDLHADTLLWGRDLLQRSSYGHVDLPRLQEGHTGLQVFSVVTGFPLFPSLENNTDGVDAISLLAWEQGWPEVTRSSRLERALYQARKLHQQVYLSGGALKLITTRRELNALLSERKRGGTVIGAMLGLEGAHALEGKLENLDRLYDLGFRLIGLSHFFDNKMAGSAHGRNKYGLTSLGRELVQRVQERGMIIDLAHVSPQAIDDTLDIVDQPVIVSHTGVRATCDTVRNLYDRQVRAIAATGGVIGIGLFAYATCGKTLDDTVKAMRHVADLVGVKHVALGSDFDGATTVFDSSGLVLLTEALLQDGFTQDDIEDIMGGNVLRVLIETLPDN